MEIEDESLSVEEKQHWESPKATELDVRSTENNIGAGGDGGGGGFQAS